MWILWLAREKAMWMLWFDWWFPPPRPVTHEVIGIDFVKRRVLWRTEN